MIMNNDGQQQHRAGVNYNSSSISQSFVPPSHMSMQNGGRPPMQPRPPAEPRRHQPTSLQPSGFLQPHLNTAEYSTSEASPKRAGPASHSEGRDGQPNGGRTFYSGEIHMLDSSVSFDTPMSPCAGQDNGVSVATAAMASPGVNHVTSSTTLDMQQPAAAAVTEHAQIDFDAMLDDGDHSSLMSGTLSPGLLQSLSQNSSRLNTPRNSITLASVPSGISNMAIGDMSSMLTALAEESKFLNLMA